jgi:hypothetical protein
MGISTIRRTALNQWLRVVRMPVDSGVRMFGRDQDWARAVGVAVDRADAGVREIAGCLFRDEQLQEDARARRAPAEERQRALELRLEGKRHEERADRQFDDRLNKAEERREEARRRSTAQRERVQEQERRERQRLADQERQRKEASHQVAEAKADSIEDRSRRTRLEQLEREADVLSEEQETLSAASEAQRLRRAAQNVKGQRKSS